MLDFFEKAKLAIEKCEKQPELKLEIEFEHLLKDYFELMGFTEVEGQYEQHAGNILTRTQKRQDATYGRVIIEYEHVGKLSTPYGKNLAIRQLEEDYLGAHPKEQRHEMVGIAFDGKTLIFVRWVDDDWRLDEREFTRQSFDLMVNYLVGLYKTSFKQLPTQFGFHREDTRRILHILYDRSFKDNRKAIMLFNEWNLRFSSLYANAFNKTKIRDHLGEIAKEIGVTKLEPSRLVFVVHTYYAFVVKIIAAEVATNLFAQATTSQIKAILESEDLYQVLRNLEDGKFFRDLGVDNFIEGTFLSWYLDVWDDDIKRVLTEIIGKLEWFDFAEFVTKPEYVVDYLKNFYQETFPKQLRHDLGEFYTPDWLARYVIREAGYDGDVRKRVLDPACGSGTFLVAILHKVREKHVDGRFSKRLVADITHNIVGFDINPVAVLTARTNYLISLATFKFQMTRITVPIYLTDSVVPPKLESQTTLTDNTELYSIVTTKGVFKVPRRVRDRIAQIMKVMREGVERGQEASDITRQLGERFGFSPPVLNHMAALYSRIRELDAIGENRIWCDIITNQFAGLFLGKFHFVIGNPPWVNWEFLDQEYRKNLIKINDEYGLYFTKGLESRLGTIRRDLSAIFFYVCADIYLNERGTLAFLLKPMYQIASGRGFRNFNRMPHDVSIAKLKTPLHVLKVEELTKENPFEIGNEVSLIIARKGRKTRYPVKYLRWGGKRTHELEDYVAEPSVEHDQLSEWVVYTPGKKPKRTLGTFTYTVRERVNFGPKDAFYDLELVIDKGELVQIRNVKGKVKDVEKTRVYPLVLSRHVKRWRLGDEKNEPYTYCIFPQDRPSEKNENRLKRDCPRTWEWLRDFKEILLARKSNVFAKDPFYSIYGLGDWGAKYKVVWKSMGFYPNFVVVSSVEDEKLGKKLALVEHVEYFIPLDHEDEAHYVCALLNSSIVEKTLRQLSGRGKSGLGAIVKQIRLDMFNSDNKLHKQLSSCSKRAHALAKASNEVELAKVQRRINQLAERLYSLPEPHSSIHAKAEHKSRGK